ncbi:MAG: YmdB family metallophosphoesterase [Treponema sp.]|jgi:metallophosphoesterase (TIGR00282 family)|nr:YmdB family metallophosphoesterase [Treponema sp.]
MPNLKVVMIGDVMGDAGLKVLEERLPGFFRESKPDFCMVNGENSAAGFGVNPETVGRILALGVDIITSGNHIWEKRDHWSLLDTEERLLRPANYPVGNPGKGWIKVEKEINGQKRTFLAINLQGRDFMTPIDCPFKTFDEIESAAGLSPADQKPAQEKPLILVDFHAESTREKEALGFYLDGRACVVAGTHTHVQTADEKILPKGTAYISDLGMTGILDAVIGMDSETCIQRSKNQVLYRMEAAQNGHEVRIQGIIVEIEADGRAVSIQRINL